LTSCAVELFQNHKIKPFAKVSSRLGWNATVLQIFPPEILYSFHFASETAKCDDKYVMRFVLALACFASFAPDGCALILHFIDS